MSDDKKVIFSMTGLTKTFPGANTPVLKNIYLSFFYGAKIGILGLNGSGKSTLLKIIAGVEKNYQGDVTFLQDYSVGFLEQEPKLDDSKTVLEIVKEGAAETVAILDEYNKINDMFGLEEVYSDADKMDKLGNKEAKDIIAMIKIVAPNMAQKVIDRAMQILGGKGVGPDTYLPHYFAISRMLRLADGPDEVHMYQLGKSCIKKYGSK